MDTKKIMRDGLIDRNPVLVQLLGLCSVLAVTTNLASGIGMGLAVAVVLICSNAAISLLRRFIPREIRTVCYIVVIASFATAAQMAIKALLPDLDRSLGLYAPLTAVNCILLGRAEAFAAKNGVAASALDGAAQGLGYTGALAAMCVARELLGRGTVAGGFPFLNGGGGIRVLPEGIPALGMIFPVGGFLTLGCLTALMQWRANRAKGSEKAGKDENKEVEA